MTPKIHMHAEETSRGLKSESYVPTHFKQFTLPVIGACPHIVIKRHSKASSVLKSPISYPFMLDNVSSRKNLPSKICLL